jgi:hypothetical protein
MSFLRCSVPKPNLASSEDLEATEECKDPFAYSKAGNRLEWDGQVDTSIVKGSFAVDVVLSDMVSLQFGKLRV